MKNKRKCNPNPFLRSFTVLCLLVFLTAVTAVGLFYYIFSIPEPEGLSPASWPGRFTDDFSVWMKYEDEKLDIEQTGLDRLEEYGLWLQVVDETGQEIFSYQKPDVYPDYYPASRLLELGMSPWDGSYTVFASSLQGNEGAYCYMIGFPYAIGKHVLYYSGERTSRLLPVAKAIVLFAAGLLTLLFLGYGLWFSRRSSAITDGIRKILLRSYEPLKERGMFGGVYGALNQMNTEIRKSDVLQEEADRARREWIANITHDLKTPLSPIKGYGELLAEGEPQAAAQLPKGAEELQAESESVLRDRIREYGKIILKNVDYLEKLLNDLRLTWQLDSGGAVCDFRETPVVRSLREAVIDIVNDPAFSGREIVFESRGQEQWVRLDPGLFRRAVQNLIINALVHNPPETKVTVCIDPVPEQVLIRICDNGKGLTTQEQSCLFNRYYRGTNTGEKPEGSGLGLAIAKQIITLHGGHISVESRLGEGTEFCICIPVSQNRFKAELR